MAELTGFRFTHEECEKCKKPIVDPKFFCVGVMSKCMQDLIYANRDKDIFAGMNWPELRDAIHILYLLSKGENHGNNPTNTNNTNPLC